MSTADSGLPDHLVLYDGVCGLCGWVVRWLIDHDSDERLMFAPIQGETAAALGIVWNDADPPSEAAVIFVDSTDGRRVVHHRAAAIGEALRAAGAWPAAQMLLRVTPRPLADLVYRFVAGIRYRVWGEYDECKIPSPEERARFLP